MAETVLLPQQGNSVESVILLQWNKAEGETVETGEVLCEVETDKTTMEVESTASGTVLKHLVQEGDEVPVKTAIVVIGAPGESVEQFSSGSEPAAAPAAPAPAAAPAATATEAPAEPATPAAGAPATASAPAAESPAPPGIPTDAARSVPGASPRARMRAAAASVDSGALNNLAGTGPGGRVIERDVNDALRSGTLGVERAADKAAGRERVTPERGATPTSVPGEVTEFPVQGIRKVIAERMHASLASTAQFTLHGSADARALQTLRARFKQDGSSLGLENVTINDMVMYAAARTLRDFPEMNAHFLERVIRRFSRVDLSFAVDTERGLMVPTIAGADTISLGALSTRIKELAGRCTGGKATSDDLSPGTFTVTNLGSFGVEYFTPVLNPPQVAILGINTISLKAVATREGTVDHVPHLGLSLTVDHQAVDGAPAARFLQELSRRIARFDLLLAR
ncbi:MAG: 2-oxo acid dehydrogenase subunit E2 [Spirochaetaceae bacterium]|nr:MAG: 2-oxo acid dehydrogenase subunit E2 [Spirochaetaceae bacterium]